MKVTAALIWYNEKPEDLMACVRAISIVADKIVAVDGGYKRYPNTKAHSPDDQHEAIHQAASDSGIRSIIYSPIDLWAGQVEKRSYLMKYASEDTDWIAIVDTDWIVSGDGEAVRNELQAMPANVDAVRAKIFTPDSKHYASNWHRGVMGRTELFPQFFRPLQGLRVEVHHWWYRAWKNGRLIWVYDGPVHSQGVIRTLRADYLIEHRFLDRTEQQILENRAFINDREMVLASTGQEDDVPGLPPPDFDFETIPL